MESRRSILKFLAGAAGSLVGERIARSMPNDAVCNIQEDNEEKGRKEDERDEEKQERNNALQELSATDGEIKKQKKEAKAVFDLVEGFIKEVEEEERKNFPPEKNRTIEDRDRAHDFFVKTFKEKLKNNVILPCLQIIDSVEGVGSFQKLYLLVLKFDAAGLLLKILANLVPSLNQKQKFALSLILGEPDKFKTSTLYSIKTLEGSALLKDYFPLKYGKNYDNFLGEDAPTTYSNFTHTVDESNFNIHSSKTEWAGTNIVRDKTKYPWKEKEYQRQVRQIYEDPEIRRMVLTSKEYFSIRGFFSIIKVLISTGNKDKNIEEYRKSLEQLLSERKKFSDRVLLDRDTSFLSFSYRRDFVADAKRNLQLAKTAGVPEGKITDVTLEGSLETTKITLPIEKSEGKTWIMFNSHGKEGLGVFLGEDPTTGIDRFVNREQICRALVTRLFFANNVKSLSEVTLFFTECEITGDIRMVKNTLQTYFDEVEFTDSDGKKKTCSEKYKIKGQTFNDFPFLFSPTQDNEVSNFSTESLLSYQADIKKQGGLTGKVLLDMDSKRLRKGDPVLFYRGAEIAQVDKGKNQGNSRRSDYKLPETSRTV